MKCCLKSCMRPSIADGDGRVEIKGDISLMPFSCDKCSKPICGSRFSCASCDFDICQGCNIRPYSKKHKHPLEELNPNFLVDWGGSCEASFHTECWDVVLGAVKLSRSRRKAVRDGELALVADELKLLKEAKETAEIHESDAQLQEDAKKIADLIRASRHCIAFTGAGISTSAGIGDYRGKDGKWTNEDRGGGGGSTAGRDISGEDAHQDEKVKRVEQGGEGGHAAEEGGEGEEEGEEEGVAYERLRPTYSHEALKLMMDRGVLKHIISQNGDGLHGLSGVPPEGLSELHGNVFRERCSVCSVWVDRPFYTPDDVAGLYFEEVEDLGSSTVILPPHASRCSSCGNNHFSPRRCSQQGCGGQLQDSIINFGDDLDEDVLSRAKQQAQAADLVLSLGTTMLVTPANSLVTCGQRPLRLVIVNRQATSLDARCRAKDKGTGEALGVRVFGDCDRLLRLVLRYLFPAPSTSSSSSSSSSSSNSSCTSDASGGGGDFLRVWEGRRDERMRGYGLLRDEDGEAAAAALLKQQQQQKKKQQVKEKKQKKKQKQKQPTLKQPQGSSSSSSSSSKRKKTGGRKGSSSSIKISEGGGGGEEEEEVGAPRRR